MNSSNGSERLANRLTMTKRKGRLGNGSAFFVREGIDGKRCAEDVLVNTVLHREEKRFLPLLEGHVVASAIRRSTGRSVRAANVNEAPSTHTG
jgi:hypothetical protein